ncbi:MAG TPA: hypothetical protein VG265_06240 [Gaiellaceae bacterium]|jgi:hypothetical protein|nr:hypothetical protein [Gaiellaceae bacterium]
MGVTAAPALADPQRRNGLRPAGLLLACALPALLLVTVPTAGATGNAALSPNGLLSRDAARSANAALSLDVVFFTDGTISATLPDGTPLGTTSGSPTAIPAGYYTLRLSGPGGCNELPYFELHGPGENVLDDMDLGEMQSTIVVDFQPSSTYTWRDNGIPSVVYTFVTSSQVLGTAPPKATGPRLPGGTTTTSSHDVVGSAVVPFRGTLTGSVAADGSLTLAFEGKPVTHLRAGRYSVRVSDRSSKAGFTVMKPARTKVTVTGAAFVGKRSASLDLTAGTWYVAAAPGARKSRAVVVA